MGIQKAFKNKMNIKYGTAQPSNNCMVIQLSQFKHFRTFNKFKKFKKFKKFNKYKKIRNHLRL